MPFKRLSAISRLQMYRCNLQHSTVLESVCLESYSSSDQNEIYHLDQELRTSIIIANSSVAFKPILSFFRDHPLASYFNDIPR